MGVSDYHKLIATTLKTKIIRIKAKKIAYRSYKLFNETSFVEDLMKSLDQKERNFGENSNYEYNRLSNITLNTLDKHTPIKH